MDGRVYEALAAALRYPGEDYRERVEECAALLEMENAEAGEMMGRFAGRVRQWSREEREERFTHSFDLNPGCTLDIGWHLFGEQYERGSMLVKMRQEMRRYRVEESAELPDHLTHALELLARMEPERAEEFAAACVLPALQKILAAFDGKDDPFEDVVRATWSVLRGRYPAVELPPPAQDPALRVLR